MNKLLQSLKQRTQQLENRTPEVIILKLVYDDGSFAIMQAGKRIQRFTKEGIKNDT